MFCVSGPKRGDIRRPLDLPTSRTSGGVLQGHREARGLPSVDHRHRGEGQPHGTHHRQATGHRSPGQREGRGALVGRPAERKLRNRLCFSKGLRVAKKNVMSII